MRTNEISFRIRYSETDQMGVVYHGNYAQYLELARVEWLRSLGISYKSMEEDGNYASCNKFVNKIFKASSV